MNDSELRSLLRAARPPGRDPEYWKDFPGRVMRRVGRPGPAPFRRNAWLAPLAWGSALALACVAIGFGLGQENRASVARLFKPEQQLGRQWAIVPAELSAIMQDEHGLHRLVTDPP